MALEDYIEPEVGIAIAVTAAVTSPKVRGVLRRGTVYGLAGILMAGDALASMGRGVKRGAQAAASEVKSGVNGADGAAETAPPKVEAATKYVSASEATAEPAGEAAETPHRRTRKSTEAAANE